MSYQVLARKWRPQNFKEMVGQEHVLRALINALDNDRLHHAYLFTGTRGVGKTTIARILAKCLNCETGVTSEPCGKCNSCKEIVAGNFVDLIEVDAASRTKVEDTRELLDNVQYAPTRGRYKVYLIDEVHMLTGHSFNALLKTLEEPPPHVKFIFATTDPQKLPVTILSRCLQFNLKRMPIDMIEGHLNTILKAEKFPFEDKSLRLISRAADGSMRDALSLLDQSIAFGGDAIKEADVRDMLGSISHEPLLDLLTSISQGDGKLLLKQVEDLSGITPDFEAATDALIALLHQIAVQQVVPDAQQDDDSITAFSQQISKEDVQLYYQIALHGRRDLSLSPDPRSGFEMLLLRMLSFRPLREGMQLAQETLESPQSNSSKNNIEDEKSKKKTLNIDVADSGLPKKKQLLEKIKPQQKTSIKQDPVLSGEIPPWEDLPEELAQPLEKEDTQVAEANIDDNKSPIPDDLVLSILDERNVSDEHNVLEERNVLDEHNALDEQTKTDLEWHEVIPLLKLGGRSAEIVKHCLLAENTEHKAGIICLNLEAENATLLSESVESEITKALSDFYKQTIKLDLSVSGTGDQRSTESSSTEKQINKLAETPAQRTTRNVAEVQTQAEKNIASDPFVVELQNRFGAKIVPNSIKPKIQTEN
jgi:DNA polymerase-3 subunit gamma/tau